METLFDGSIVFLYLLGTFVIINYEMFSKKQKVIIIYVLSYGMLINGNVGILEILALMLLTLFIYEELLNEDKCKCQYVHGVVDRILDYLFMYVFIYKILYIVFGFLIYYKGTQFFEMVSRGRMTGFTCRHVTLILSAVFLFVAAIRMLNDGISLHSFSEINAKFQKYPYYKFLGLSNRDEVKKKLEMVTEVEDKTFFLRNEGFNICSLDYLLMWIKTRERRSYKQKKKKRKICSAIQSIIKKFQLFLRNKHRLKRVWKKLHKYLLNRYFENQLAWKRFLKRCIRGHSTIEMQLIRILAFETGLIMGRPRKIKDIYYVGVRKIFEIVYSRIFFRGLKRKLQSYNYKEYFRYYLVYVYLHTVRTNLNGRVFDPLDKVFSNIDIDRWPSEGLFIIIMGLNTGRISWEKINRYSYIINRFDLNEKLIRDLARSIDVA